ncbi:hypothetical protein KSP39_PZI017754 [Platanthera zijinensis]|uniref:Uncharacterized protein n=1 Tax=Platanthera zijinensis TaxID=2320716 RepID=A0AAP0B6M5_9ASPA
MPASSSSAPPPAWRATSSLPPDTSSSLSRRPVSLVPSSPLSISSSLFNSSGPSGASVAVLSRLCPKIVIDTVAYVSIPICFSVVISGIKLVIQEQNCYPRFRNHKPWPSTLCREDFHRVQCLLKVFPQDKSFVCGNPCRLSGGSGGGVPQAEARERGCSAGGGVSSCFFGVGCTERGIVARRGCVVLHRAVQHIRQLRVHQHSRQDACMSVDALSVVGCCTARCSTTPPNPGDSGGASLESVGRRIC